MPVPVAVAPVPLADIPPARIEELRPVRAAVVRAAMPGVAFEPTSADAGYRSLLLGLADIDPDAGSDTLPRAVVLRYFEPGAALPSSAPALPAIVLAGVGVVNLDDPVVAVRLLDLCLYSRCSARVGLPPGLLTAAMPLMLCCYFSALCYL